MDLKDTHVHCCYVPSCPQGRTVPLLCMYLIEISSLTKWLWPVRCWAHRSSFTGTTRNVHLGERHPLGQKIHIHKSCTLRTRRNRDCRLLFPMCLWLVTVISLRLLGVCWYFLDAVSL